MELYHIFMKSLTEFPYFKKVKEKFTQAAFASS